METLYRKKVVEYKSLLQRMIKEEFIKKYVGRNKKKI